MSNLRVASLLHVPQSSCGFQPLQARSHSFDKEGKHLGTLYKTYRNDPDLIPGRPIWVYAIDGQGGWAAISELSEADLEAKVLQIRHPKKKEQPKPYR